jgi:L-rhamnonate dehydratase
VTRIASIEAIPVAEPGERPNDEWVTTPSDVFLEPGSRRTSDLPTPLPGVVSNVIVRVRTDDGLEGLGTVGVGSPASKPVIDHHLAPLVVGASPFDVELLWERMFRATINIGRKGLVLEAISAIDIALWDILGKATGQPLYNLLGGRTRDRIRAYVSQSYAKADLDAVREEAASYREQGFTALKMRFGYGPSDGEGGKRANHELVAAVREAIGPDTELMADAYMGWDLSYAIDMIRRLEDLNLRWVEEPLVPDDIDGYVRLRSMVSTPISAGEHEFTRWGYRELLTRGAVDIVQPDVNRMGGITEARKVWALASAFNVPVVPHSHQSHNAHLIMAHLNSPLIEFFPTGVHRTGYTFFTELFEGEPEAVDGWVELGDAPGLGITLDEDVLEEYAVTDVAHA